MYVTECTAQVLSCCIVCFKSTAAGVGDAIWDFTGVMWFVRHYRRTRYESKYVIEIIRHVFKKISNLPKRRRNTSSKYRMELLLNKTNKTHEFHKFYFVKKLYMFRAFPLPVIRSFLLYIRHWYISCRFDDSFQLGSCHQKSAWNLPMPNVQ